MKENSITWYLHAQGMAAQTIKKCEGHALTLTNWGRIVLAVGALKKAGPDHVLLIEHDDEKEVSVFTYTEDINETKVWNTLKQKGGKDHAENKNLQG